MTDETGQQRDDGFEWAIVEIFGRRQHVGKAREEERFGSKMLRIDVPTLEADGHKPWSRDALDLSKVKVTEWSSHYYGGSSIFSYTPTDEMTVMRQAARKAATPAITYRDHGDDPMDADFTEVGDGDAFDEVKGG